MGFQVLLQDDFVDEAAMTGPVVLRQRGRQRQVKAEVRKFRGEAFEVILIKYFLPGTRPIPEAHAAGRASVSNRCDRCARNGAMPEPPPM